MSKMRLLIVEGQVEKKFFKDFKEQLKFPCNIKVFNIAQNILKLSSLGIRYDYIGFVIDADRYEDCHVKKIIQNFQSVNAKQKSIFIQVPNFEQEFATIQKIKIDRMYEQFGACSASEFKKNFLAHEDISKKIKNIDFPNLYIRDSDLKTKLYKNGIPKKSFKIGKDIFR